MTDTPRDWREPVRAEGPVGPVPPTAHLVVGFDRHPAAAALAVAIELAAGLGAHLHVVHVIDADDLPIDPDAADWDRAVADIVDHERAAACAQLSGTPGNWTYYVQPGTPAQLLGDMAETVDATMIVIGAPRHGVQAFVERVLGESVSARLIRHGHRPLLLVPERASTLPFEPL